MAVSGCGCISVFVWMWCSSPPAYDRAVLRVFLHLSSALCFSPLLYYYQPLGNRVFFCGEATVVSHELATLNGALVSGAAAAEQVIASLVPKNKL